MPADRFQDKSQTSTDIDFADLYKAHLSAVLNFCLFNLGDYALAEEITAQTFEKAWRHRGDYDPNLSSFVTWIFTIARNLVRDAYRHGARTPELLPLEDFYKDDAPSPEEKVLDDEKFLDLSTIIPKLAPDERELIALKFGAGLTNRKIAELCNKSETAIGTALYRIMRKLRSDLEKKS